MMKIEKNGGVEKCEKRGMIGSNKMIKNKNRIVVRKC